MLGWFSLQLSYLAMTGIEQELPLRHDNPVVLLVLASALTRGGLSRHLQSR